MASLPAKGQSEEDDCTPRLTPAAAKSLQSCPTLCDHIDGSPPGSLVPGILQARTLEWVAIPLQCIKVKSESEVTQSCPTLRDPMDCSPPGSFIMGFSRQEYWSGLPSPSPMPHSYSHSKSYTFIVTPQGVQGQETMDHYQPLPL